jgi:3-methyladenine DNA glycosylase AlkD
VSAAAVQRAVDALGDPARAQVLQRYFKTGSGDYGEGDVFAGVKVGPLRGIAKDHRELPLDELELLLESPVHEHRTVALVILVERAATADLAERRKLYDFYLTQAHAGRVNNWDLVDISCRELVGSYLLARRSWASLKVMAHSRIIWERRIAIVSTWPFIRDGQLKPTFAVASLLIDDEEDLIHKATGWMLREAGKQDQAALEEYLEQYAARLPRTALRYAVERMTPERRQYWRSRS